MQKKYCEYCGDTLDSSKTAKRASARPEEDRELEQFLNHFANVVENEDAAEDVEDDEKEDTDEKCEGDKCSSEKMGSASPKASHLVRASKVLDKIATQLEKTGQKHLAFEVDKVADLIDQYC